VLGYRNRQGNRSLHPGSSLGGSFDEGRHGVTDPRRRQTLRASLASAAENELEAQRVDNGAPKAKPAPTSSHFAARSARETPPRTPDDDDEDA
jgi:hypothetical protein